MTGAYQKCSEGWVELDLVWQEGPRSLWRRSGTLLYIGMCRDCNVACPATHRIDAEDWADWHDCSVEPVDGD